MLAIITPTGGRLQQLQTLRNCLKMQIFSEPILWIIVDDMLPYTAESIRKPNSNYTIHIEHPEPTWQQGMNTQFRNLYVAMQVLKKHPEIDRFAIMEDDDCYMPLYLFIMNARLQHYDLIGEGNSVYYNPSIEKLRRMRNMEHISLFQTLFNVRVLDKVINALDAIKFIDIKLSAVIPNKHIFQLKIPMSIGIKGLPGRAGIGSGHNATIYKKSIHEYPDLLPIINYYKKLKA